MKIERVNERQIRCTLTGTDLERRQLKLSELAYGSEKAKLLFSDMMKQAKYEFGFEADDIPLVIEAIPVNSDCIILIITKVDDPEELDTRFSKFAPLVSSSDNETSNLPAAPGDFAEEMINMLKEVKNSIFKKQELEQNESEAGSEEESSSKNTMPCLLTDTDLDRLASFSRTVVEFYHENSSLLRNSDNEYLMIIEPGDMSALEFARVCNIASEFARLEPALPGRLAYVKEHCRMIIEYTAVEGLSCI
ncbi:MAG: adaptor protein MecA [Lachnospiraceae bacterium]|nr:adaptor protein MecA [Lachnospiraceae bacterium]